MGCPSEVNLGDNLTFSICTHDPDTGELTNADALPIYRVYEDETAVPVLTGTMTLLDAGNTTGFYTEEIECTAANGFEDRGSYTVYIEATVDSDTGGIPYGFRVTVVLPLSTGIDFPYTVINSVTTFPEAGVQVWFSTDILGSNVIWSGITDTFGVARDVYGNLPRLDAGTYYAWKRKGGFVDDDNPDVEVVS